MVKAVTRDNFETEVLQSETPVLVDFTATWCGPCRAMEPVVKELAEEYDGKIKVVKLDIDDGHEIAAEYNIRGVPTFILFQDGAKTEQWVGLSKKQTFTAVFDSLLSE